MSSNPSNRTAAQRERERRAAARAKRQAAKAVSADVPTDPAGKTVDQAVVVERKATPAPARKDVKAPVVADADAVVIPLGDEHGDIAIWMMLGVVFLLALLVIAVASAS